MTTLFGIKNCDTVKKARNWLQEHQIDYQFHDFKTQGLSPELLDSWIDALGWDTLLNKRSTTWRQLPQESKDTLDATSAKALMLEQPTLIKRPVLSTPNHCHCGFKAADYQNIFND